MIQCKHMFAKEEKRAAAEMTGARKAILDAAAEIFAVRGYRAATIREICAAAGANIALVSRYFGSKQGLYAEVCRSLFNGIAAPLTSLDADTSTDSERRAAIREWIGRAIHITSATKKPIGNIAGIFRQEMFSPSAMHDYLKREFLEPVFQCFRRLVEFDSAHDEAKTLEIISSVWSQVIIYALLADIWQRPFRPSGIPKKQWIERIADGIAADVFARLERK